jgi:hypothetical protein
MGEFEDSGIDEEALRRFVAEQIYTLPGTDRHRDLFTVLLTGSRAFGMHAPESDVDIDVFCPRSVWESVHRASLEAGLVKAERSFFVTLKDENWDRYFGRHRSRPHFALVPLEEMEARFREYDDVWLWIYTNAKVIADPNGQFGSIVEGFSGYPPDILVGKIKYRWLLSTYWAIEVYPHNRSGDEDLLPAATAVLNAVNDLLRVFLLVEGRPFPYPEKLVRFAPQTKLGREFCPLLLRAVEQIVGLGEPEPEPWKRLDAACGVVSCSDDNPDGRRLWDACTDAMIAAGVDRAWVKADYGNIDELLLGELGPVP